MIVDGHTIQLMLNNPGVLFGVIVLLALPACSPHKVEIERSTQSMKEDSFEYGRFVYRLDRSDSELRGSVEIQGARSSLTWMLRAKAIDTGDYDSDDDAPPLAPSADAYFKLPAIGSWRSLQGKSIEELLPEDTDISVYTGFHEFATSYRVNLVDRRTNEFLIHAHWDLDVDVPVDVYGWFPLTGVLVHVDEDVFGDRVRAFDRLTATGNEIAPCPERDRLYADMISHASNALRHHLKMDDFGEPEIRMFFFVWYPLVPNGFGGHHT